MGELGRFDSWNIISSDIAIKHCDKSFFEHNGSGLPMQIRWFFGAENLPNGRSIQITLLYEGSEYSGRITKEGSDLGRTRIFWASDLGDHFKKDYGNYEEFPEARFEKVSDKTYKVSLEKVVSKMGTPLHDALDKFISGYLIAKEETFGGNAFGVFVRSEIPNIMYDTGLIDAAKYLVTGSVGQGNWAAVPWVCIFDRSITTSATRGVYIVYLLSKDGSSLYLTFNQGCTDIRNTHSKKETIRIMREKAASIVSRIDSRGFRVDEDINLGEGLTELAEMYQKGTIFYKEYKKDKVPSELELQNDLSRMLDIYKEYVQGATQTNAAWLLTWNPNNWEWKDYNDAKKTIETGGKYKLEWACANTHVKKGDRVFITMLGMAEKNGIFASGIAASESYQAPHYNKEKRDQGIRISKIDVDFDVLLSYEHEEILKQTQLESMFPNQRWNPQGSGIEIKEEYRSELEEIWNGLTQKEGEAQLSTKETIARIKKYISAKGFTFNEGLVENYYLCLKSKPFVILAGTSGTGKTRLVRLFAEAIGATVQNGRYKLVSVRPDWSDSSDLFGHVNLNGKFIPGVIIDFVKQAELDSKNPYFLCLDEMNLARVEYYLSDILSIIETREYVEGKIITDPLIDENYYGADNTARGKYGVVRIPENLYIVGTVNMDETTFPFSRKVLDRANTIEFSTVELLASFADSCEQPKTIYVENSFMKADYVFFSQCAEEREFVEDVCIELQQINKILESANAHVGYRVRDEIVFYMLNNKKTELLDRNSAFDHEIMQKILPRIQGGSASVKRMLCELFRHCAGDYEGYQTENDDISSKMLKVAQKQDCKYKESAKKIAFMVRRFEEDGFTAYWL